MNPVTLEITVSPMDWRHAVHVLPHQLRQWAGQVDDVQFTVNRRGSDWRYGDTADTAAARLDDLLDDLCRRYPKAHVREVDYSGSARAAVAERFFRGRPVPLTTHSGGPFYSYWYGWHVAKNDHVLHADSDMLFGGGSQTWVAEALHLLASRPDVLTTAPLPGPPTPDGSLPPRIAEQHGHMGGPPVPEPGPGVAWRFHGCSTRIWLVDRASLAARLGGVPVERPRLRTALRARVEGHPPVTESERSISRRMNQLGLRRVDFLGTGSGMWSLHPKWRSEEFYDALPELVRRVEAGDVPDEQRGDYDVNDSLVDWSSARAALRRQTWQRRLAHRARRTATSAASRLAPAGRR